MCNKPSTTVVAAASRMAQNGTQLPEPMIHRLIGILLIVTAATGAVDAICIVHFGAFAAAATGTIVLLGAHVAGQGESLGIGLVSIAGFLAGAILGGRLARRKQAPVPMLADALFLTAALTGATALVVGIFGIAEPQTKFVAIFILAVAMGEQIAATRMLNVAEMLMPAATMIVHGLGYDSPAAGGRSERTFRRVGVVLALCAGAASGALLAL